MPRMYIISGCNGSGKTTASYTVLAEQLNLPEDSGTGIRETITIKTDKDEN